MIIIIIRTTIIIFMYTYATMYTSEYNGRILVCHCAFPSVKPRGDNVVCESEKKNNKRANGIRHV